MKQKHTSQNTSINSTKLPAIYHKSIYFADSIVIDYGCGRYTDHLRAAIPSHCTWHGYDPYNQPEEINQETDSLRAGTILCSNVLNVIDSEEAIMAAIRWIRDHLTENGCAWFTVYEGDKTGIGRETQNGQSWQRNERLRDYVRFIQASGMEYMIHSGMIQAWTI